MLIAKKILSGRLAELKPTKDCHRVAFVITFPKNDVYDVSKMIGFALTEYVKKVNDSRWDFYCGFDETADFVSSNGASIQVIVAPHEGRIGRVISHFREFFAGIRADKRLKSDAMANMDGLTDAEIEALGLKKENSQ